MSGAQESAARALRRSWRRLSWVVARCCAASPNVRDSSSRARSLPTCFRNTALGSVEQFGILMLDTKHRVIRIKIIAVGSVDMTVVHPREVFREAAAASAAAIVLFHNHPSGDPTPSHDDLLLTSRMAQAGEIMGIDVIDHIILADQHYFSLVEAGRMQPRRRVRWGGLTTLYFDCFSGAAGDMILGALVDAGVPLDDLRSALGRLAVDRDAVWTERVTRAGITATKFCVRDESPARTWPFP